MNKKPTYDISSNKRLHEAERPKSFALSIMPKSSLNAEVEAWVASGGVVVIVTDKMKHAPVVMNQRQRKLLKKDDK